jgi:long-chain acyl-CoA synthetase
MSYLEGIMPLKPVRKPPFTVEVEGYAPVEGETIPRRHPKAKNGLISRPADDVFTIWDLVKRSSQKYAKEDAVGSRKLIKVHKETKKVPKLVNGETVEVDKEWQFFELTGFTFLKYEAYMKRLLEIASGLRKLGLEKSDKVHFFASTRFVKRFVFP